MFASPTQGSAGLLYRDEASDSRTTEKKNNEIDAGDLSHVVLSSTQSSWNLILETWLVDREGHSTSKMHVGSRAKNG